MIVMSGVVGNGMAVYLSAQRMMQPVSAASCCVLVKRKLRFPCKRSDAVHIQNLQRQHEYSPYKIRLQPPPMYPLVSTGLIRMW